MTLFATTSISMTSLVRNMLDYPGDVCSTVTSSITQTKQYVRSSVTHTKKCVLSTVYTTVGRTQEAAVSTKQLICAAGHLALRPFVWPVHLTLDLSRRVILQLLVTVEEILDAVGEYLVKLNAYLSRVDDHDDRARMEQPPVMGVTSMVTMPSGRCGSLSGRHPTSSSIKVNNTNRRLRHRLKVTEAKYEALRAEISALRELYCDKMADLEGERDTVEKDRRDVMNIIHCAHALAGDCHGDVQTLMEDLQSLAKSNLCYTDSSSEESLTMDYSMQEFRTPFATPSRLPGDGGREASGTDDTESGIGSQLRLASQEPITDVDSGWDGTVEMGDKWFKQLGQPTCTDSDFSQEETRNIIINEWYKDHSCS